MHTNHDQISVPSKVSPVYHWLYPNHVFASPFSLIFQYQNGTKKMFKNGPPFFDAPSDPSRFLQGGVGAKCGFRGPGGGQ